MTEEQFQGQFGPVVVLREVGQEEMAHMRGTVRQEEFEGLPVGKVSLTAAYPPLEVDGITALLQHVFVVVGFQEGGVTQPELADEVFAGGAYVGKDPYMETGARNREAMGVGGVVKLGKGGDRQCADVYGFVGRKVPHQTRIERKASVDKRRLRDVHRELVFSGKHFQPADMVGVFVGDKNRLYHLQGEPRLLHPPFGFTAGNTGIHKDALLLVADIVAVAVAARIE